MPGSYFTASDIAGKLEEQNRTSEGYKTWRQMYGAIDLAKQQELSTLKYDTDKSIADAYAEAYAARQQVTNTNYFDAYKRTLDEGIAAATAEAYDSYLKNYREGVYSIESQAQSARENVTKALSGEAERYAALANKPYEYLQNLYNTYYSDETRRAEMLKAGVDWSTSDLSRFLKDEIDQETGEPTGEKLLKSWDELATEYFDKDIATGDRILNEAGINFYDMMLNNPYYSKGMTSFDEWLAETDSDLYGWYSSQNPYTTAPKSDVNQNTYGGSAFRKFIGMKSSDMQYDVIDKAKTSAIDTIANDVSAALSTNFEKEFKSLDKELRGIELETHGAPSNVKKSVKKITESATEQYSKVIDKLKSEGLYDSFVASLAEQDIDISSFTSEMQLAQSIATDKELWKITASDSAGLRSLVERSERAVEDVNKLLSNVNAYITAIKSDSKPSYKKITHYKYMK